MKLKFISTMLFTVCVLCACQTVATPLPLISISEGSEFTLAPDQSAVLSDANLTITFKSVSSDNRCPREIECAVSGPVQITLSVQQGSQAATDLTLATFTDQDGRAAEGQFEGIENSTKVGSFIIRIAAVSPYPQNRDTKIKPSEYRATLIVTQK